MNTAGNLMTFFGADSAPHTHTHAAVVDGSVRSVRSGGLAGIKRTI